MGFLAPLYLALAAAAAVPLLLHLMRRRSGTRVEFPAVRYLQRAEQEHSRHLRLRNLLLMLLRVAAVLLIALAAARPVGRMAGAGHPPTALAVVLDNSLSTGQVVGGRPVLDELKQVAGELLDRASAADRLWLVTADGRVETGSAAALKAAVQAVRPYGGAGRLPDALARAAGLVEGGGLPARQIALLTDGQATSWAGRIALPRVSVVVYAPTGTPAANRAVAGAEARPARWTPRGGVVVRVRAPDSAAYRIALGGRTLARGRVAPGEEELVQAAPSGEGWTAGTVEVDPDELRADDARHFAVWLGRPVPVTVDASAGAFAAPAIATLVQSGRAVAGGQVTVAGADGAARLPALLLAPTDPVRAGAANRNLERLGVPWRFGAVRRGRAAVRGERVDGASASLRYELQAQPGAAADTLATAGGDPWMVAGDGYVLVASPLVPTATDLPVRAGFVPLLGDLLSQRLSSEPGGVLVAAPGQRVRVPAWVTGVEGAGALRPGADGSLTAPAQPGVYFLIRGTARAGALVVNPEPDESVLERLSPSQLRERLGASDVRVATAAPRFVASAFDAAGGRALATPLLAGALLLLVAESLVTRRGQGRA
ncbi:MAG TPA: VWA domain-containing protein [Gemmatimonadaceae bacterium]|nr:VWA domain-containing protein [Gemmatimonadaceae bacterium]